MSSILKKLRAKKKYKPTEQIRKRSKDLSKTTLMKKNTEESTAKTRKDQKSEAMTSSLIWARL